MKLALLGCDDEAMELVASALAQGNHSLVAAYDAAAFQRRLQELAPRARYDDKWESLLVAGEIEAVIVARGKQDSSLDSGFSADERRVDQLRKLAQMGVPMLVIHPACEMIIGYELEMIRADRSGIIQPFIPGWHQPAVAEMQLLMSGAQSPLGEIEQVVLERQMVDRSRSEVLKQFARDASLLRQLLGTIRQVAATGPAGTEYHDPLASRSRSLPSLANLSVHLSGERPFSARWSVGPVDDLAGGKLVVIGSAGRASLRMPQDPCSPWALDVGSGDRRTRVYEPFDAAAAALARLESAISQAERRDSEWIDACRDLEAAAVIDRSLEKGRAIALFTDDVSEQQSFKGVMAIGGCLVLAATLAGLMVVVFVEALQLDLRRSPLWRAWPVYLVAPILIFLVLQVLQVVARGSRRKSAAPATDEASESNSVG